MTDYRAFGECQKIMLGAGASMDLTPATASLQTIGSFVPKVRYQFAHILTMADTVLAGVTLSYDLSSGGYPLTLTGQCQVVGVTSLNITSGLIEVFLFA